MPTSRGQVRLHSKLEIVLQEAAIDGSEDETSVLCRFTGAACAAERPMAQKCCLPVARFHCTRQPAGGPNLPRDRNLNRAMNCHLQQVTRRVQQRLSVIHNQRRVHSRHDPAVETSGPASGNDCHAGVNGHACQHCDQKNANGPSRECEDVPRGLHQMTNSHAHGNAELQLLGATIGQLPEL